MVTAQSTQGNGQPHVVATYDYFDERGVLLFQTVRYEPGFEGEKKTFRQRRPHGKGRWIDSLGNVRRVLYRLPELVSGDSRPVFVVEGEKDADNLQALGLVATTNPMGAGRWQPAYSEFLRGKNVIILPDNDDVGRRHAEAVARSLAGIAASIAVVKLPDLPPKGDVTDWLEAGGTKEALLQMALDAPSWEPPKAAPEPRFANGRLTDFGEEPAGADDAPFGPPAWEEPIPLAGEYAVPAFPVNLLPYRLASWVQAEAGATQTPPDLAGCLVLAIVGAALAGKFRVIVRDGWSEPLNLFTVVSLPPGDRKSAVFADALAPVQRAEAEDRERMEPIIAELASAHRVLENRLKATEIKAAKAEDPNEAGRFRDEARQLAKELVAHKVPDPPQFYCDDVTPEKLTKLLARQGGRMLQASAEGTAFEIAKGRYSETANFDVYLKGHAGDPLRNDRIGREQDATDRPALSVALAVQPDVLQGLADQPSLRGRGFLARFLYSLPVSLVGRRAVAPAPVSDQIAKGYWRIMAQLWELPASMDATGKPAPNWLRFAPAAERALRSFETWLEPRLAEGEELSHLAGWANKLAGAIARIAGIFHVVKALSQDQPWQEPIPQETVECAIRLGRDYFLGHALAAFGLMGADPRAEVGKAVLEWLKDRCEYSEYSETAPPVVSRRDIHQAHRRKFKKVEDVDPVLELLVKHGWLHPTRIGQRGRGHQTPTYWVNPVVKTFCADQDPRTHCTHCTHNGQDKGDAWEGDEP